MAIFVRICCVIWNKNVAYLRDIEPIVSEAHSFGRVLDRILGVPILPVRAETRCNRIDEGAYSAAVVPVGSEIRDGQIRHFRLDPMHQSLFRRGSLVFAVVAIPHGHGDRVVQDQSPYQAEDQLQLAIYDVRRVCG